MADAGERHKMAYLGEGHKMADASEIELFFFLVGRFVIHGYDRRMCGDTLRRL